MAELELPTTDPGARTPGPSYAQLVDEALRRLGALTPLDIEDAVGDGVTDDTEAWTTSFEDGDRVNSWFTAPPALYVVTETLLVPSNSRFDGVGAGVIPDGLSDYDVGTQLRWAGSANGKILSTFNKSFVTLKGIVLHGGNISGVVGLLIDSNNSPANEHISVEDFGIYKCGLNRTNGIGVSIGPNSGSDYQADKFVLRRGYIIGCGIGIQCESANALYGGLVELVTIANCPIGIHLTEGGNAKFANIVFGGHGADFIADVLIDVSTGVGVPNNITFDTFQTEGKVAAGQYFLHLTNACPQDLTTRLTLRNGVIADLDTWIDQTKLVTVDGCTFNNANVIIGPTGAPVLTDLGSQFFGDNVRSLTDAVTVATDATLTSAAGAFTSADVGKRIRAAGIPQGTTVSSVTNSTTIEMDNAATVSASGVAVRLDYGYVVKAGHVEHAAWTKRIVRKTVAEAVTSSTTLQSDDELGITGLDVFSTYTFKAVLIYDGPTAGDFKVHPLVPANSEIGWGQSGLLSNAVSAGGSVNGQGFDALSDSVVVGCAGAGTKTSLTIEGMLTTKQTAGSFSIQWAQGTSDGTATNVYPNSYLEIQRVDG